MVRNLFGRIAPTGQDIQMLHGVVARLRRPKGCPPEGEEDSGK